MQHYQLWGAKFNFAPLIFSEIYPVQHHRVKTLLIHVINFPLFAVEKLRIHIFIISDIRYIQRPFLSYAFPL
jgi:hypothetical protein